MTRLPKTTEKTTTFQTTTIAAIQKDPKFGACDPVPELLSGEAICTAVDIGYISSRCRHTCQEGKWLHGFQKIQCRNGNWEEHKEHRSFLTGTLIDMDIDLTQPICIDHCPCRESNACQPLPLSLNKAVSVKMECPEGGKINIQARFIFFAYKFSLEIFQ
jgi:hypothetical protein